MKQRSIIHSASRLTALAGDFICAELAREGITDLVPAHGDILTPLFVCDRLSVSEIARRTHRTKSTVSVLSAKLEKLGYVTRTRSVTDLRALDVMLTERGAALKPVFDVISQRLAQRLARGLTSAQADQLEQLLQQALRSFSPDGSTDEPNSHT